MNKEKIKIQDESGDRKYFTQIPNYIANHSTAIDQALYFQMKRYAGEDGKCFATQETLMKKLGIGKWAYRKSLNYLLKKKWVRFIGLTGGKTRPIKTYSIVDIWKLNVMEYEKIVPELAVSLDGEIVPEIDGDTGQNGSKIPARLAIEEEPPEEEPLRKTNLATAVAVAGNRLNEIIPLFQELNPNYEFIFKDTTQRAALERLLKKMGREKLAATISFAAKANTMPYAPTITTPYELERNLGKLVAFYHKENGKGQLKKQKVFI